jgi:pantothenate kinase type III
MILLTGDLGNSRCKLRLWSVDRIRLAAMDFDSRAGIGAEVSAWLAGIPRADDFAVCSVASPELEEELLRALESTIRLEPRSRRDFRPDPGLRVDCRAPEEVGRDRLFAARGALELSPVGAIVVDAGTALTVDAVRAEGVFLGGAIAPGPALLARVLAEGTARLPRIAPSERAPALGRDTEEALQVGVVHGFRGAARELVDRVSEASGLAQVPVVLAGGARGFLREPTAFPARRVREEPDLVHIGLLASLGGPRRAQVGGARGLRN